MSVTRTARNPAMFIHSSQHLGLAALTCLAALLHSTRVIAEEQKIFTQKPEVAAAQVRGEPPAPMPKESSPPNDLFKKGPTPLWIWGAENDVHYVLRKEFSGGSTAARLKAACDNRMRIAINGQRGRARGQLAGARRDGRAEVPQAGDKNVLTADVTNEGGPAGFVLQARPERCLTRRRVTSSRTRRGRRERSRRTPRGSRPARSPSSAMLRGTMCSRLPQYQHAFQRLQRAAGLPGRAAVHRAARDGWAPGSASPSTTRAGSSPAIRRSKGLCRITPPAIGGTEPTKVEHLDVKITSAQGLLYAFDSLYVSVNGGPGSGLYRVRDTNGDDQFDEVVKLCSHPRRRRAWPARPACCRRTASRSCFVCGNHTGPAAEARRQPRARRTGAKTCCCRAVGRQRPCPRHPGAGRLDRQDRSRRQEAGSISAVGYRNAYDIAFNADGELFAYDADMEWDMGMPWYRPTRLVHATSGSEFGWRSGTGKWPAYYVDSLPPMVDIGPGSPVGMAFGYGTKFPAKYQKALFCCDWTFGTIYALHLEPDGSTYKAVKEEFLSRTPLPLTDVAVGPDGALYFTIGGRGTQSELFRVTYVGKEPTDPGRSRDARGRRAAGSCGTSSKSTTQADGGARRRPSSSSIRISDTPTASSATPPASPWSIRQPELWQERVLAEKDRRDADHRRRGPRPPGRQVAATAAARGARPSRLRRPDRVPAAGTAARLSAWSSFAWASRTSRRRRSAGARSSTPSIPAKTDPLNRELCSCWSI